MPGDSFNGGHNLLDGLTAASAKVQRGESAATPALQEFDCHRVRFGEVGDMDVISNAGAV